MNLDNIIGILLCSDVFIIIRDYLMLEDLFVAEYTWNEALLRTRLKLGQHMGQSLPKYRIGIGQSHPPKWIDALTAKILLYRRTPNLTFNDIVTSPPYLRIVCILHIQKTDSVIITEMLKMGQMKSLQLIYRQLFATTTIDFMSNLGRGCIMYLSYDPDFADIIRNNEGFNVAAIHHLLPEIVRNHPSFGLSLLHTHTPPFNVLFESLQVAVVCRQDNVIHAILDIPGISNEEWCSKMRDIFLTAVERYPNIVPALLDHGFYNRDDFKRDRSLFRRHLPPNHYKTIMGYCGVSTYEMLSDLNFGVQ